jgi:hypothetical protein
MEMRLLYILYCPPHPCNVTARIILNLGHSTYTDLPLSPPPILRSYWLAQRHTTPILPSYWLAQRHTTAHYAVMFCLLEGEGGTGITSPHLGWQRAQIILVLVILMPHMENGQG